LTWRTRWSSSTAASSSRWEGRRVGLGGFGGEQGPRIETGVALPPARRRPRRATLTVAARPPRSGRQVGSPTEIIRRPATPFIMKFVGDTNDVPSASLLVRRSRRGPSGGGRLCGRRALGHGRRWPARPPAQASGVAPSAHVAPSAGSPCCHARRAHVAAPPTPGRPPAQVPDPQEPRHVPPQRHPAVYRVCRRRRGPPGGRPRGRARARAPSAAASLVPKTHMHGRATRPRTALPPSPHGQVTGATVSDRHNLGWTVRYTLRFDDDVEVEYSVSREQADGRLGLDVGQRVYVYVRPDAMMGFEPQVGARASSKKGDHRRCLGGFRCMHRGGPSAISPACQSLLKMCFPCPPPPQEIDSAPIL
jgi:hypothetical protein